MIVIRSYVPLNSVNKQIRLLENRAINCKSANILNKSTTLRDKIT